MSDEDLFEPYRVPVDDDAHPARVYARLIELEEHAHFKDEEIRVEFLMKVDPLSKGGKQVLGAVHIPAVQGKLKDLFDMLLCQFFGQAPHFLIILDAEFWENASDREREALLYHELCHVKQETDRFGDPKFDRDGNPVFGLVEHDITAFNAEVARYGAWHAGIVEFLDAAGK